MLLIGIFELFCGAGAQRIKTNTQPLRNTSENVMRTINWAT